MVDHHILDDLDTARMGGVDEVLIACTRRFQTRVDTGPVVGMVTVIIEPRAVLHRRRDPDRGETQILDVVQPLDQSLEIAAPMRVDRRAIGRELDAIAAEEIIGRITIIKARGDQEVDRLLPKILPLLTRTSRNRTGGLGVLPGH